MFYLNPRTSRRGAYEEIALAAPVPVSPPSIGSADLETFFFSHLSF